MRAMWIGLALLATLCPAASQELRPLREVFAQENSPTMMIYAFKRCAGAMAAVGRRMAGSGRDDVEALVSRTVTLSTVFMMAAADVAAKNGLNETAGTIKTEAEAIAGLYAEAMQRAYLATGNAIGGDVQDDFTLCSALAEK